MSRKKSKLKIGNSGITLVALVVTIVVLLILSGITITMLFGESGIITKAQQASEITKQSHIKEQVSLAILASYDETNKVNKDELKNNLNAINGISTINNLEILRYDGYEERLEEIQDIEQTQLFPMILKIDNYYVGIDENTNVTLREKITLRRKRI